MGLERVVFSVTLPNHAAHCTPESAAEKTRGRAQLAGALTSGWNRLSLGAQLAWKLTHAVRLAGGSATATLAVSHTGKEKASQPARSGAAGAAAGAPVSESAAATQLETEVAPGLEVVPEGQGRGPKGRGSLEAICGQKKEAGHTPLHADVCWPNAEPSTPKGQGSCVGEVEPSGQ